MPKAFIPDRDMPRKNLKPREYSAAMVRLRERVKLGEFLATQENLPQPDDWIVERHERQHAMILGWAHGATMPWCGRCYCGDTLWNRYLAGVIQPIYPVEEDQLNVVSIKPAPKKRRLPHLPRMW